MSALSPYASAEMWTRRTAERMLWTDPVHQDRSFILSSHPRERLSFGMNLGILNYRVASVLSFLPGFV